jgi:FkbM family methyltransferase
MSRPPATTSTALLARYVSAIPALTAAVLTDTLTVDRSRLTIPGGRRVRLSVVASNVRMRALIDARVSRGDTVMDVGANIGAVALHAAGRVGPEGRVLAIEPAADNVRVLRANVSRNQLSQVTVIEAAAGSRREARTLYVRGEVSAVNSFYAESVYASVTAETTVPVVPLDDICDGPVALVKIDVEGAELDVLAGMGRILGQPGLTVIAEWHPLLQRAAGHPVEALPSFLLDAGFAVDAVGHLRVTRLDAGDIAPLARRLIARRRPIELVCERPAG